MTDGQQSHGGTRAHDATDSPSSTPVQEKGEGRPAKLSSYVDGLESVDLAASLLHLLAFPSPSSDLFCHAMLPSPSEALTRIARISPPSLL